MTLSEVLLWQELKGKQVLGNDFDRQRPIDNFIVDFYCKELNLAIEIDGESHDHEEKAKRDIKRLERFESLGVRFLRFDDKDIKNEMNYVVNAIHDWIMENTKDPPPAPPEEGSS